MLRPLRQRELEDRINVFTKAGLIKTTPTTAQLRRGGWAMAPLVVLPYRTEADRYSTAKKFTGKKLGHFARAFYRSAGMLPFMGFEHFNVGPGFHISRERLARHIALTAHEGDNPAYDLQLAQTHPFGLDYVHDTIKRIHQGETCTARLMRAYARTVMHDADEYHEKLLDLDEGWITKADQFEYPFSRELPDGFHREFMRLDWFLNWCTNTFPKEPQPTLWKETRELTTIMAKAAKGALNEHYLPEGS